jgi:hypothetical protein
MKLTIIKEDNMVLVDNHGLEIDLSTITFPENFWALQWNGSSGHIEYNSPMVQNDEITALPEWANASVTKWQTRKTEIEAEEAALAAAQAQAEAEAQTP